MKFRTGLIVGLGVGYILGAKAGTARYEQIMAAIDKVRSNESVSNAVATAEKSTRKPRSAVGRNMVQAANTIRTKVDRYPEPYATDQPDSK